MFNYDYNKELSVERVTFEISLKPFKQLDDAFIEGVCRDLFDGWKELLTHATGCAVMFWTSDGSEILDYSGNMEDSFEWCRYVGIGNPHKDPEKMGMDVRSLHVRPILYMENPPVMHYSDLKRIIATLKRVGKEMTGFEIQVGETFDPGPEFAYSEFKYERHNELSKGDTMGSKQWIHCAAKLNGDTHKYASYPTGVPDGTHFGTFLGKQFMKLKEDVGFDYIWLSNGFGFALNPWGWTGQLFDGEKFNFENYANVRDSILEFWKYFTAEVGTDVITETRGTNLSTAMDISAHGCPVDEIYKFNMAAPPNSPWAALDDRFGLELVGFMSRIAELPKNGYPFRYYTHDPWWLNSPWFDRYARSPHDIYLPLSISRIDENGNITKPRSLNFLSVDDSFGNMPRKLPIEITPSLLEAYNDYADAPGLVTWVYPFDYYCDIGLKQGKIARMMMDDWLIESAIDYSFPLNSVISDKNFDKVDLTIFKKSILLMPVPEAGTNFEKSLFSALNAGLRVILYGDTSAASEELKALIGVRTENAISGNFEIKTDIFFDRFETATATQTILVDSIMPENGLPGTAESKGISNILIHDPIVSTGGICEVSIGKSKTLAEVKNTETGEERIYALYNEKALAGSLVWIRGSFPHKRVVAGHLPPLRTQDEAFAPAVLFRGALTCFGYSINFDTYSCFDKLPLILNSAKDNALYFTGFAKDSTVVTHMSYPDGAPLPNDTELTVENDIGTYPIKKSWHSECRTYIKQKKKSKIIIKTTTPMHCFQNDHRLKITGLMDADVTFYAPRINYPFTVNDERAWIDPSVKIRIY